jgi:hypothetical protein
MKRILFLVCFCVFLAAVPAQENAFFCGLGLEVNMNTRLDTGAALGGSFTAGYDINRFFGAGAVIVYSHNMDTLGSLEPAAFFRWYLPLEFSGPFVQAEAGLSVFFENGEAMPAFNGGLAAGWRFRPGQYWYIEPSFRGGYPFLWGCGISAGLYFAHNKE